MGEGRKPFPPTGPDRLESTTQLLRRIRQGDREAINHLCSRYAAPLRRWAHGRLPARARDLLDTDDLVQDVLLRTVRNLKRFHPRRDVGFHSYLRLAMDNRIRDEIKRAYRAPQLAEVDPGTRDGSASPLEEAIGKQAAKAYETGLAKLDPQEREAVVARVELGMSYREIADFLGKPTPDAARMAVSRSLIRLAQEMGHDR